MVDPADSKVSPGLQVYTFRAHPAPGLSFQDSLIAAGKSKGSLRRDHLQQADIQLEQLRLWLRFSRDNGLLTIRQYEHSIRQLREVGNLLGAWLKQV